MTRRLSERVLAEAQRLGRIVEDLLDLSRIESAGATAGEPIAVVGLVDEAVERVRPVAEHRRVAIQVTDVPDRLRVVGERRQLMSAFVNLLDNAVQYSDAGSRVDVDVGAGGSWIQVAVRDRGIGIPARDIERIFERFYRVDRSRARDTGGTGLGLAIVRHVAEVHGGEVVVESREGEGSTFTLRLPSAGGPIALAGREAG